MKHTEVVFGRIVSVADGFVIIEDLTAPGSRYNRAHESLFEVHKDTSLNMWVSE